MMDIHLSELPTVKKWLVPLLILLLAALNPCPCGFFGHPTRECTCSTGAAARYLAKVSGSVLDRLDIHIEVPPVDFQKLSDTEKSECSADSGKSKANKKRSLQKIVGSVLRIGWTAIL